MMTPNYYVIVEGETDAAILARVLAEELSHDNVEVKIGYGRSSAVSLARTMLVSRPQAKTALVVDSDSTDKERIEEMAVELEGSLADVAHAERFEVFLLTPTIEACLFQDQKGLEEYFGGEFSSEETIQSRYDPKFVIQKRLDSRGEKYDATTLRRIVESLDVDRMSSEQDIHRLIEFVAKDSLVASAH